MSKENLNFGRRISSVLSSWGQSEYLVYCGRESDRALRVHQSLGPTDITGIHVAQFGTLRLRSEARMGGLREGQ